MKIFVISTGNEVVESANSAMIWGLCSQLKEIPNFNYRLVNKNVIFLSSKFMDPLNSLHRPCGPSLSTLDLVRERKHP